MRARRGTGFLAWWAYRVVLVERSCSRFMGQNALSFLLLLLRSCAGASSTGMSYGEGRSGSLLRALPGVRRILPSACGSFDVGGVAVGGAVSVCDDCFDSGKRGSAAESEGPIVAPPKENPKSISLVLCVLSCSSACTFPCYDFAG